jgi:hypothetical protein
VGVRARALAKGRVLNSSVAAACSLPRNEDGTVLARACVRACMRAGAPARAYVPVPSDLLEAWQRKPAVAVDPGHAHCVAAEVLRQQRSHRDVHQHRSLPDVCRPKYLALIRRGAAWHGSKGTRGQIDTLVVMRDHDCHDNDDDDDDEDHAFDVRWACTAAPRTTLPRCGPP